MSQQPVANSETNFELLWDGLDVAQRLYVAALAHAYQPGEAMALPDVTAVLKEQSLRLRPHKVSWSVDDLQQQGLLLPAGKKAQLSLAPPAFHEWVRQQKPLSLVKEQLDQHLDSAMDVLFQAGRGYLGEGKYEEAAAELRKVVNKVPYHVGAQISLGRSLLALGSAEAAVKHLERAYKLDVAEAGLPFADALLTLAEMQLETDGRNEALATCEQFYGLAVADGALHERAKGVETAVWNQRGDMAFQRGLLDKALMAYEKAGNQEKIAQLKDSSKPLTAKSSTGPLASQESLPQTEPLENLEAKAKTLFQTEAWSEAAVAYEKLLGLAQTSKQRSSYQKLLAQALEEIELARYFDEGVKAVDNGNWLLARMSFNHVVNRRREYMRYGERAASLLEQATKGGTAPLTTPAPETAVVFLPATDHLERAETGPVEPAPPPEEVGPVLDLAAKQLLVDKLEQFTQVHCLGKGAIKQVVYSHDGQLMAVATAIGVYLYQAKPLTELWFVASQTAVHSVTFSPDNQTLATGTWQHRVNLWRVADGELLTELRNHDSPVKALAFAPDGQTLASADENGVIITWQVAQGHFIHSWEAHRAAIHSLTFSPDGKWLLSGSEDKHFCLWQVDDEMQSAFVQKHNKAVVKVAFSPDSKRFFSVSRDGTVAAWQLNGTSWLRLRRQGVKVSLVYSRAGHHAEVNDYAFSSDGKMVASASADCVVRLWNMESGELLHELEGHTSPVISLAFAVDGQALLVATEAVLQFWQVATRTAGERIEGHMGPLQNVALSDDGRWLATADPSEILLLSLADLTVRHRLAEHKGYVYRLAFSPQSNLLASASADHTASLWDVETGSARQLLAEHNGAVMDVAFSPDGAFLATASEDETIGIWRVADGEWLRLLLRHRDAVTAVGYSHSGKFLASGSTDQTIHIWNLAEDGLANILEGHKGLVWQVVFSPDDSLLASAALDHTARLWRLEDGSLQHTLTGHDGPVWSLQFSADGQFLATGGGDNTVRLWYVADGSLLRVLTGHTAPVSSVVFTSDGTRLISASADGTIRIWGVGEVFDER